jgi:hypothetical protein
MIVTKAGPDAAATRFGGPPDRGIKDKGQG